MSRKIETMYSESGRVVKENGDIVNIGDVIDAVFDSVNGLLKTSANVNVGDISIGAVELKDSTTETRATVGTDGLHVDVRNMKTATKVVTFHDEVSITGSGSMENVEKFNVLGLSCKGGNTSRTIEVHGVDANGVDNIITGYAVTDSLPHATLTTKLLTVEYTVRSMVTVYAKITSLAGGDITIVGMLSM